MNSSILNAQLENFASLNQFASKGQIVFFGSTLLSRFPIYELKQDFSFDQTIYNRGIQNLTIDDAKDILKICVYDLLPGKLFLGFGDSEQLDSPSDIENYINKYSNLICEIQRNIPDCKIYLISAFPEHKNNPEIHQALWKLSIDTDCEFVNLTPYIVDRPEVYNQNQHGVPAAPLKMQTYAVLFQKLRIHFYSSPITFGEMWSLIN